MKITVFTSNQPRHIRFIERLARVADEVFAVQECVTLFPGVVADSIYKRSPVMERYFAHVHAAESRVFGDIAPLPANVRSISLKMGDIAHVTPEHIAPALNSDHYIVFGAGYIKPPLVDVLIEKRAINIHAGVSPYFRGSSCNFWAIHDGHPGLVGCTIHRLSRGLDSGDMLFHALPKPHETDPFTFGMKAIEAAHAGICEHIKNGTLHELKPQAQDRAQEIRYSRYADFTDEVADAYLKRLLSPEALVEQVRASANSHALYHPFYY